MPSAAFFGCGGVHLRLLCLDCLQGFLNREVWVLRSVRVPRPYGLLLYLTAQSTHTARFEWTVVAVQQECQVMAE
jgi:hypothetical protein